MSRKERLDEEIERERIRREARRQLDAEERGPQAAPDILTLRDWLEHGEPAVAWRLEGWQPIESRIVAAAAMKAGKTTLVGSLVRSLVDGDPWLGRFRVEPVNGAVAVLDTEMLRSQLRRWLREQRIVLVISDGLTARIGTICADREQFIPWRTIDGGPYPLGTPPRRPLLSC